MPFVKRTLTLRPRPPLRIVVFDRRHFAAILAEHPYSQGLACLARHGPMGRSHTTGCAMTYLLLSQRTRGTFPVGNPKWAVL